MSGPLAGLMVLDFTRVLSGPYCTMMLRDLGARVIKVERPQAGDDSRRFPPFIDGDGDSAYFITANRGKESVAVDFSTPAGVDIVQRLADGADVLVENFSPGTLERRGLDPAVLTARNPRLVVARISGMGQTGPDRRQPAYDITVQARSGLMSLTGAENGEPVKVGCAMSDIAAGIFGAVAILAALYERDRSGRGQVLDISMLDATVAMLENAFVRRSVGDIDPKPLGCRHPSITPFDAYQTGNGRLVIGCGNDAIFERLCRAVGHPEWIGDPRFATNEARTEHQALLKWELEAAFAGADAASWVARLQAAQVPAERIQSIDEVMRDPQVIARGLVQTFVHPRAPDGFAIVGSPFGGFSRTPGGAAHTAPALGEHTDAVLSERLGLDGAALAALRTAGVVA